MKALSRMLLLLLTILALVAVGCGDDDDNGGTDTMTTDTMGGDTMGADTMGTDTNMEDTMGADTMGTDTNVEDTGGAEGACQNADDLTKHDGADPAISDTAAVCGQGCVGDGDPKACSSTCIIAATAISQACADCYADSVLCTINSCLAACLADPNAQGCIDCRETEGCTPGFYTCSGFTP